MQDKLPRYRQPRGRVGVLQRGLLSMVPLTGIVFILGIPSMLNLTIWPEQYLGLFLGLVLANLFLNVPHRRRAVRDSVPWFDLVFALWGLGLGLYIAIFWKYIISHMSLITPARIILGIAAILLVLEGIRRLMGWSLVIICGLLILYARWADVFPDPFVGSPTSWFPLIHYLYLNLNSMMPLVKIAGTIGVAFIFFGNILTTFGAARIFTDFALAIMGRFRGGAAKVAIIASSLVGTMAGGAVANVMITGPVTIPMMKSSGYPPEHAAATEACSSTGGQVMPPVMGIAAFLIAQILEIPYVTVALAALIPAGLYYLCLFVQVDLEAAKRGIRGLTRSERPSLRSVMGKVWIFLGPLTILVYTLFILRMPPSQAGVISSLIAFGLMIALKENRKGFLSKILSAFENTSRSLMDITVILAGAGFVVGALTVSGIAFSLGFVLTEIASGNLMLLLFLAAVASLILGMGMPTPPAYILVATLVAPGIVAIGIPELTVHLFVFYFAMVSNFTPPVAIAAFAAAGIAGGGALRSGFLAMRLGILAYIVPFLFILSPPFLLSGSISEIGWAVARSSLGVGVLGCAIVGYLIRKINWIKRLGLALAAIGLLLAPELSQSSWVYNLGGGVLASVILIPELLWHVDSKHG
jgi:TRAP transporter 4TM/12TM fusion protein